MEILTGQVGKDPGDQISFDCSLSGFALNLSGPDDLACW